MKLFRLKKNYVTQILTIIIKSAKAIRFGNSTYIFAAFPKYSKESFGKKYCNKARSDLWVSKKKTAVQASHLRSYRSATHISVHPF